MYKRNFEHCCGATEIGGFGWDVTVDPGQDLLNDLLAEARAANKGFAICTTVRNQTAAVMRLKAQKFRVLATFNNPNTGNAVTLWGRETVLSKPTVASSK
jgi:hypothetical protein